MNNQQQPLQWPDYQIIEANGSLKKKALQPGDATQSLQTATDRATRAMEQLSAEFPLWMNKEAERLRECRDEIADKGLSPKRLDALFNSAHDLKGQAQTLGYPLASVIGHLLCELIEGVPKGKGIPLPVINQYVDTILIIAHENIEGIDNPQINRIISGLEILGRMTLEKIPPQKQTDQAK